MERDPSYSPDVEIDAEGRVIWARCICKHETVQIPMHMMARIIRPTTTCG